MHSTVITTNVYNNPQSANEKVGNVEVSVPYEN